MNVIFIDFYSLETLRHAVFPIIMLFISFSLSTAIGSVCDPNDVTALTL